MNDFANKTHKLTFRVTEKEKRLIIKHAHNLGYKNNLSSYFRGRILRKEIEMVNPNILIDELYLLRAELNKIGSNLNQVANYTNILIKNNIIEDSYKKELAEIHLNFEVKVRELKNVIDKTLQKV